MAVDDLDEAVRDLAERVTRLERARPKRARDDTALVQRLIDELERDGPAGPSSATVVYAGAGPWEDGVVAWQVAREWGDIRSAAAEPIARVLSALANGTRVRIVSELLRGSITTGDLAERLDQPSSGQLFHHLKELIAAGLIHQPVRGTYAIPRRHVVPLLALLSAASDLAGPAQEEDPS
jgi:DNA-binding transcriptional ArsR family regulator